MKPQVESVESAQLIDLSRIMVGDYSFRPTVYTGTGYIATEANMALDAVRDVRRDYRLDAVGMVSSAGETRTEAERAAYLKDRRAEYTLMAVAAMMIEVQSRSLLDEILPSATSQTKTGKTVKPANRGTKPAPRRFAEAALSDWQPKLVFA